MRSWFTGLGIAAAVAILTAAYVRQPTPRSLLGDTVGIRRSAPFARFCGWFVRDTPLGAWPTGTAICAWYRPATPDRQAELDQLRYHVLTRRVSGAQRSWEPLSHEAWRRDVDSVRTALRAHGGVPSCLQHTRNTPDVREYWRFPHFEIALFTGVPTMPSRSPEDVGQGRLLLLRGAPGRLPECEGLLDPPA